MSVAPQYHFRRVGADVHIWDVRALLDLADGPVIELPLDAIAEIDEPYWFDATSDLPTCRAVMAHAAQAAGVDLSYPILLCPDGRVIDGMHRVMKAVITGATTIPARKLAVLPPPDYRNIRPSDLPY